MTAQRLMFDILAWDDLDNTVTVSINGTRYEYFLNVAAEEARFQIKMRKRNRGQQLSYIKKHSREFIKGAT
jgi:hypothetical protein